VAPLTDLYYGKLFIHFFGESVSVTKKRSNNSILPRSVKYISGFPSLLVVIINKPH